MRNDSMSPAVADVTSNLQQLLSTLRFWETRSRDTGEAINTNTAAAAAAAASDDDNDNDDDV